jgi:regulatory protein
MIITAVDRAPKRRGCVRVHLDGVSMFEVSLATARKHDLTPGRALTVAEAAAIEISDARHVALASAAAMLARRAYSEHEVRQRLLRRGCDDEVAGETIQKLTTAGLLDDGEYAQAWTESRDRISPRGRRLVERELRANGVSSDTARQAADQVSDADAAMRAACRRLPSLRSLDHETFRKRLGSFLQRRGFDWETCGATAERCWQDLVREAPSDDRQL